MPSEHSLYTARELRDIAEQFDRKADNAARQEKYATTETGRRLLTAEVLIWREAANILRNTTLSE